MILSYQDNTGAHKMLRLKTISSAKPVTIGRGKDADVPLEDNACSRIHCAIRYWDDIFVVRDVNSHNGTFLNGQKIKVAELTPGDVLKVGDTEFHIAAEEGSSTDVTMGR
jgi:pSer/pThr/pTyr-binding forkhead associated (FHA) protein